jgi:hypothetical protein
MSVEMLYVFGVPAAMTLFMSVLGVVALISRN